MLHEISARDLGPFSVLSLAGEFDLVSRRELETSCQRMSDEAPSVVVDLSGVTFLDVGTVNVLDLLVEQMHATSRPSATVAPERLHRLLRLIGYRHVADHALADDLPGALLVLGGSETTRHWSAS